MIGHVSPTARQSPSALAQLRLSGLCREHGADVGQSEG